MRGTLNFEIIWFPAKNFSSEFQLINSFSRYSKNDLEKVAYILKLEYITRKCLIIYV